MESLLRNMAIDFKEANTMYPVVLQTREKSWWQPRNFRDEADLPFNFKNDVAIDLVVLFNNIMRIISLRSHSRLPTSSAIYLRSTTSLHLWTYGFHKFLKSSSSHLLSSICKILFIMRTHFTPGKKSRRANFQSGWLETLGDLTRCRMAEVLEQSG